MLGQRINQHMQQRFEDGEVYVKCACGGTKRAFTEDLLDGEEMLNCDTCCRCIRLIFEIDTLKMFLREMHEKEQIETGNITVIVEDEVPPVPPRKSSLVLRRPPTT